MMSDGDPKQARVGRSVVGWYGAELSITTRLDVRANAAGQDHGTSVRDLQRMGN